jgi:hypothetical protein
MATKQWQDYEARQLANELHEKLSKIRDDNLWRIGKHSGKTLDQLPTNYLHWVIKNIDNDSYFSKFKAQKELAQRIGTTI